MNVILKICLFLSLLFVMLFAEAQKQVTAETLSEDDVRRHVEKLLEGVPPPFGKWDVPIFFAFAGVKDQQVLKLFNDRMAYLGRLSMHEISLGGETNGKINFLVLETKQYEDILDDDNLVKQLSASGESREAFAEKLKSADADSEHFINFSKRFMDRNYNVKGYILLDKLKNYEGNIPNKLLDILTEGLVDVNQSDEIVPSIFNSRVPDKGYFAKNVNRLPLIDEAMIRAIYKTEYNRNEPREIIVSRIASQVHEIIKSQD